MKIAIRIVTLLMLLASTLLAYADQIQPLVEINPTLAHLWPFAILASKIFNNSSLALLDWLRGGTGEFKPAPSVPPAAVILLLLALPIAACTLTPEQKSQAAQTGVYAASKVARLVAGVIANGISQVDTQNKVNISQGLAYGLRTQEGNILTGDDIKALVGLWTPGKAHWQDLGGSLADIYDKAAPAVGNLISKGASATDEDKKVAIKQSAAAIEQLALGLDKGVESAASNP